MRGPRGSALLMSGGIGDYLHYLTRLDSWLAAHRAIGGDDPTLIVESTVPHRVAGLFAKACPDLQVEFVPPAIHWTKTNPLLVADRAIDRINRPAYRYVVERGYAGVTDWFLPNFCGHHLAACDRLRPLAAERPIDGSYVVISAREKGFLWWPRESVCRRVEAIMGAVGRPIYLGTSSERLPFMHDFVEADDVAGALAISLHAAAFIGTDTGTATIRELLGYGNVYCVNQFWIDELMVRYGYWTPALARRSGSVLARSESELVEACEALSVGRAVSVALDRPVDQEFS